MSGSAEAEGAGESPEVPLNTLLTGSDRRRLDRVAVWYAVRRAYFGFFLHRGIDSSAALTFYTALAFFPASLAVVSIVGLLDPNGDAVRVVLNVVDSFAPKGTTQTTRLALEQFTHIPEPVLALTIGLGLTIWAGASYATAFGRTVNAVYQVTEGRRFIKLRLLMLVESVALVVLLAVIIVIIIVTPEVARAVVLTMGWPLLAVDVWSYLKWPLLVLFAVFTVIVLYYGTPNMRRPRVRWVSIGATFAIAAWAATTAGYYIYVSTFAGYDRLYGLLSGAIITLVWLFLSNLMLVFGVEVDAEFTRARQLLAGLESEGTILVGLRDTKRIRILLARHHRDVEQGLAIREEAARLQQPPPAPPRRS
ncbi:YihY/virulence factor BrkB family protein [Subtercola endophyticus]|uniref:YihY/virulence factor BrkB family protein n=1 Tax=Subtercola endophyticus TaxID=2895559 RepID=UPI001E45A518|nr:YihY/virulence factor BrkB family protein [Subtercola endophyticus]UFS60123.1 YihY/virulence factor BrkB family protein [Subtercola endophyticus]